MELLYNVDESRGVIFAIKSQVVFTARIWDAIFAAKTWRELNALLPDDARIDLEERLADNDLEFDDEVAFDRELLPGYGDGDYPAPLQQSTLDWFPLGLVEKYGVIIETRLSGESVAFPAQIADLLVRELQGLGYSVEVTQHDLW